MNPAMKLNKANEKHKAVTVAALQREAATRPLQQTLSTNCDIVAYPFPLYNSRYMTRMQFSSKSQRLKWN
ncbi:hypothetical protein Y032_0199g1642 [Ancylostoma ceylanicum]|uniref:Uncharacterized protein n=1 Tax=Ancylostoma ceylanicum TaxID=53326 RepID=A0A016SNQ3_9BILA|nr:hypothetical protein Y032_0199g1642 [Ancylostoma ceylanicum]